MSGEAAPGATVRLYLNESLIAPGCAGGDGKVSFSIGSGVKPGEYRVRLDDVDPVSGQVKSRAEVGFNVPATAAQPRPPGASGAARPRQAPRRRQWRTAAGRLPDSAAQPTSAQVARRRPPRRAGRRHPGPRHPQHDTAIVSRGDSLWRISQRIYGRGDRYTVIYGANQTQIRNPHLIYPGQIFVLPSDTGRQHADGRKSRGELLRRSPIC